MKYDLVIFDLDGTALETIDDIAAALNASLNAKGFPTRTREQVRKGIGGGVGNLIRCSVPKDTEEASIQAIIADFKERYARDIDVQTHPFDGIPALFEAIRQSGIHLAINSNKIDAAVTCLCQSHFPGLIEYSLGEHPDFPKKPAPDGARHIMAHMQISPERTLYVGDGDADIQTAKNAGIDCAWVAWGYRTREELGNLCPEHTFDTVKALQDFILG